MLARVEGYARAEEAFKKKDEEAARGWQAGARGRGWAFLTSCALSHRVWGRLADR